MTKPITAALFGVTHPHSMAHLRTLQALPEIERILLWDEDGKALEEARASQPDKVVLASTDASELLKHEALFALVSVPSSFSAALCEQVLEAGWHVLAEKPIGRSVAEVARVVEVAERRGLQLGVCYQNRRSPIVREARSLVGQGVIGRLIAADMRMVTTQVQFRDPSSWLFKRALSGGGVLSWLGCHQLDMMRFVSGDEIVSVSAEVATRSGEAIDVEDVAVLALRFASGAVGLLHMAYALRLSGSGYHNVGGYDISNAFNGCDGRIYWTNAATRLYAESAIPSWASAPKRSFDYELAGSPSYGGVSGEWFVRDFIGACLGEGEVPASGRDALQVARIVEAAYESSRDGRRVAVPPFGS